MTILPALLAVEALFDCSLFVVVGILSATTITLLIAAPYGRTLDNIHLFVYRFLLITICGLQIGFNILLALATSPTAIVYTYPWAIQAVLAAALLMFLAFIIYKFVQWIRSNGIIDVTMYNKVTDVSERPFYPQTVGSPSLLYPVL